MVKVLSGVLLLVLLNVGIYKWTKHRERVAQEQMARAAEQLPTRAGTAPAARPPSDPGFLGVILAGESVDLEAKTDGRVESIAVVPGSVVKRGQRIAQLEVRTLHEELAIAKAGLNEAQQRLARRIPLAAGGLGAVTREELSTARVQVVQERARVAQLEQHIAEAIVVAPADGTIAQVYLAPGALGGPGRPIARLIMRGDMRTRFAVPEDRAGAISVGSDVRLDVRPLGIALRGKVVSVTPDVDVASGMVYAVAALDVPAGLQARLSNGLVARVLPATAAATAAQPD